MGTTGHGPSGNLGTLPSRETLAVIELVAVVASDQTVGEVNETVIDRVQANAAFSVSALCIYKDGSICDLRVSRADDILLIYLHRGRNERLVWHPHSIQVEKFKILQMEECIDV